MSRHKKHPTHCLNCGADLSGRYCSNCGQDSQEHPDSIWHLLHHFLNDITHYDGKFWNTVSPLLIRPGFLTMEYMRGKRASYLNPVRMFIFLNFVFFLLMAWLPTPGQKDKKWTPVKININEGGIKAERLSYHETLDSLTGALKEIKKETVADNESGADADSIVPVATAGNVNIAFDNRALKLYDSLQDTKPADKRNRPFMRHTIEALLISAHKMESEPHYLEQCGETFMHNLAKLTFLFLIVCTALLGLLYYRRRMLTVNHALFAIHLSCTFLLLSALMLLISYLPYGSTAAFLLFLYGNYYLYRSMLKVYHQGYLKTAVKFLLLDFSLAIIMGAALMANGVYTMVSMK